ncbi:MAG: hypothetical protein KatS3mg005_0652 [Bryobacteraceae bacterium]|nr:MAG: hypothetical protein KatS3mg005_0652 [Bryobacteraceae bacterium]
MRLISLALWGICSLLHAQTVNPVSLDYRDRGFRLDENGSPFVDVQMENRSPKAVHAIGLLVLIKDGEGKTARNFTHWIGMPLPGQPPVLAPGARRVFTLALVQPSEDPALARHSLEIRLDYVRFGDGSDWGPDKTRSSFYFTGFESGARIQKQHLRALLLKEGDAALRKYLEENR